MPDVTACLVTRGDQPEMMKRIVNNLIFDNVIVWDNSRDPDWKCAGRYMAAAMSPTEAVYFQDDDVFVPQDTQQALYDAWNEPGPCDIISTWGHGENPDGYDDLPLVCGGAIAHKQSCWDAIREYAEHWPLDTAFMYEADFAVGVLYPEVEHLHLPFDINYEIAQHPSRLCNQPWQKDLKLEITNRARAIRDGVLAPA